MLLAAAFSRPAQAGAWPQAPGETVAILKHERSAADEVFDASGGRVAMADRADDAVSLYVERGLTRRLTLQGQAGWTRGEDGFADYAGRGPLELGLRYNLVRSNRSAVSVYVGAALAGEGRNGLRPLGANSRLLAGRSLAFAGQAAFVDLQLARLDRTGLPDETRLDLTLGVEPTDRWLILVQTYAGQAGDGPGDPRWLKLELSAARRVGEWRLQAGWRQTLTGRSTPVESGPVFAVWRSF